MLTKQYSIKVVARLRDTIRHRVLTYAPQIGMKVSFTEAKEPTFSVLVFIVEGTEVQHSVFQKFFQALSSPVATERRIFSQRKGE